MFLERFRGSRPRELPTPSIWIVQDVLNDLLGERNIFIKNTVNDLSRENPHLSGLVLPYLLSSPNRDFSENWTFSYYEIYSRSARKSHIPMVQVSTDLIVAYASDLSARTNLTPEERFYEELSEKHKVHMAKEKSESGALDFFWSSFEFWRDTQRIIGRSDYEIDLISAPLYFVTILLHEQQDANRIAAQFTLK